MIKRVRKTTERVTMCAVSEQDYCLSMARQGLRPIWYDQLFLPVLIPKRRIFTDMDGT